MIGKLYNLLLKEIKLLCLFFCSPFINQGKNFVESTRVHLDCPWWSLWEFLDSSPFSLCKTLTVYQSLTGFSQINLGWVFVRVDFRTRVKLLALSPLQFFFLFLFVCLFFLFTLNILPWCTIILAFINVIEYRLIYSTLKIVKIGLANYRLNFLMFPHL